MPPTWRRQVLVGVAGSSRLGPYSLAGPASVGGKRTVRPKVAPTCPELAPRMNGTGRLQISVAGMKESEERKEGSTALESVRSIEAVRYQIMLNRLSLNNFLLSGDPRDEEKVTRGLQEVTEVMKRGESQAGSDLLRTALIQVEGTEASWADNFAKPLLAKRHQVDSGDATVSDLQIFYLQKDPASWLVKSSAVLDQSNVDITKSLDESTKSAARASAFSTGLTTLGTLAAVLAGLFVAFYTAKSITEPLTHLITVAREIGDSADLDQNIDIHRNDESGALATTFNNMVAYLNEMAGVSMAVAEGDLSG